MATDASELVQLYLRVLEAERDAAEGCRAAARRVASPDDAEMLLGLAATHARHVASVHARLGAHARTERRLVLTRARVRFAARQGPRAVLLTVRRCERELVDLYLGEALCSRAAAEIDDALAPMFLAAARHDDLLSARIGARAAPSTGAVPPRSS
jgi:hypothetical protein